jgi:hypothetical protein
VRYRTYVFLLAGIAAFAVGCTGTATADTRKITLTKGDTVSVRVGTSGNSTITVKIQQGKPDAGTYTSTSEALLDDARDAVDSINRPGAEVWIRVDEQNRIATIGNSQKLQ